jgi:hypothetical protein
MKGVLIFLSIVLLISLAIVVSTVIKFSNLADEQDEIISEYEKVKQIYQLKQDTLYCKIDSLNKVIVTMGVVIDSINEVKQKTYIIYEYKYKDYTNVNIVSNDSISRYISSRLSER